MAVWSCLQTPATFLSDDDEIHHGDYGSGRQTALLIDVGIICSQFYDRILINNKTFEWEELKVKEKLLDGNGD